MLGQDLHTIRQTFNAQCLDGVATNCGVCKPPNPNFALCPELGALGIPPVEMPHGVVYHFEKRANGRKVVGTVDGGVIDHFLEHGPLYVGHKLKQRLVDQRDRRLRLNLDPGVILRRQRLPGDAR